MADDIASTSYVVLNIGRAKMRFGGASGRPWDEQHHDLFAVQLPDQPLVYGEWRQKWAKNGNDFDIEIIDFGLLDATRLAPTAITKFMQRETSRSSKTWSAGSFRVSRQDRTYGPSRARRASFWDTLNSSQAGFASTRGCDWSIARRAACARRLTR